MSEILSKQSDQDTRASDENDEKLKKDEKKFYELDKVKGEQQKDEIKNEAEDDNENENEDEEDEEEEYEDDEEVEIPDFKKVEQAEKLIKHVMQDKELEYRFLLEIKSKNYDEAEFIAAQILAKNPNNESVLLFWDMLRKHKKEFYQMDEDEKMSTEEEEEEGEDDWEEVDEYDYNDGEEYEDEYEVEDDEDGWKTEDEYDTDEKEDEEEEEEELQDDEEEEVEGEDEEDEEEYDDEELEQIDEKEELDQIDQLSEKKNIDAKQVQEIQKLKKPEIKKKERNSKSEFIHPYTSKQDNSGLKQVLDSKNNDKLDLQNEKEQKINKITSINPTKEIKPPLKPLSAIKQGQTIIKHQQKSQSISSVSEIKKPLSAIKRPPSISLTQQQKETNRPPSQSLIQTSKEATRVIQSAKEKRPSISSINSDKLPPINKPQPENRKSISSAVSTGTQQKRASSSHRAAKSVTTNISKLTNNKDNSFTKL